MEHNFQLEQGSMTCWEKGNQAEILIRVRNDGRGLYQGWIRGEKGKLQLGTLAPEQNELCLRRNLSMESLKRAGCWPIIDGGITLIHSFSNGAMPQGWRMEENPSRFFQKDPLLREAAGKLKHCMLHRNQEGFSLAVPFGRKMPFGMIPIFCFARVRTLGGKPYAVFLFDKDGCPRQ